MKRKKWSEQEEQTLLSKYSELLRSGTLAKLKTREKKFKPVADHLNSLHHLRDPTSFPFKWSWRDVSIKVQNMRHQYLGVKQKIRVSPNHFNWSDGLNHWENFLLYKAVFGDVDLNPKAKRVDNNVVDDALIEDSDENGNNYFEEEEGEGDDDDETDLEDKGLDEVCRRVVELRDAVVKREERRREREFRREEKGKGREGEFERERKRREREEWLEERELELEERELVWLRREVEKRVKVERELEEERRWRKRVVEKMEEEEMEWKERMVAMQIEHEKQMMQMHADACQNQMQILGIMARLFCQFFGSATDGLGALPPQVLQNLQHSGGLGDNGKPDANSPSEFM